MLFICYRHKDNLKATRLRFYSFIIFQNTVQTQILAKCSNILLLSMLHEVFCSVCCVGCAVANPEHLSGHLSRHVNPAEAQNWRSLKWTDTAATFAELLIPGESLTSRSSWLFNKTPFFRSHSCSSLPPESSRLHKGTFPAQQKIAKPTSEISAFLPSAVKSSRWKTVLRHFFACCEDTFWTGNLWMWKTLILNEISTCVY